MTYPMGRPLRSNVRAPFDCTMGKDREFCTLCNFNKHIIAVKLFVYNAKFTSPLPMNMERHHPQSDGLCN